MTTTTVSIWRPLTGGGGLIRIPQPSRPRDAELSADGNRLAVASAGKATVRDAHTGKLIGRFSPRAVHSGFRGPTQPVRVALNSHGDLLALGTTAGSVELWNVTLHRQVTSRVMTDTVTGISFPVTDLSFAASGSALLAANYPELGTGDSKPQGSALVLSTGGRQVAALTSPAQVSHSLNPGVALSPDGGFVLGGIEGFAPGTSVPGGEAVYLLEGDQQVLNLQGTTVGAPPTLVTGVSDFVPFTAWAHDGVRVLTGATAVYNCDACGPLARLESAAVARLAWGIPLTPARDHPPDENSFS
jgi:WD40 repeat protein